MKTLLFTLLLGGLSALPALAADAPKGGKPALDWNAADAEMTAALKRQGDLAKGKVAYEICRGCHKADASGRADAGYPQLAGQHASVLIKQMVDVRAGRRDSPRMHPFISGDVVPAEEIADIAAYLQSLPVPTNNAKGKGRMLDLGKHLYVRDCQSCHGAQGEGDASRFYPRVAGQHYPYLAAQSRESRDQGRRNSNPEMVKVIRHYTDSDIEAVSDYMSRLKSGGKAR